LAAQPESDYAAETGQDRPAVVLAPAALPVLSVLFAFGLALLRLPAALLLGPMIAAVAVAATGSGLRVPPGPILAAQAVIGCLPARSIPPSIVGEILRHWLLFVAVVAATTAASSPLGWPLTRWRVLPGNNRGVGSAPGAAQ